MHLSVDQVQARLDKQSRHLENFRSVRMSEKYTKFENKLRKLEKILPLDKHKYQGDYSRSKTA